MRRARRSHEGLGVAMRDVLLVEWVYGDGVGGGEEDWFIARYAQTTPMSNVATSDQPILDLRRAQESFIPPA